MKCPHCQSESTKKFGSYIRPADRKTVQRFRCRCCERTFSQQTISVDYRLRKRRNQQGIFRLLCSGVSQRRCAMTFNLKPEAIARRIDRFGMVAECALRYERQQMDLTTCALIDEMETFEHTKCKPLTIPIAVDEASRKILALEVGKIAAKGPLAAVSRKKYGERPCERSTVLDKVFEQTSMCMKEKATLKSDRSRHYPSRVRRYMGEATHFTCKGRRGCVVGQGELKAGGYDPLFMLNHTYAMVRDNIKRLSRRTWCTTKRIDRLRSLLFIYACFHNQLVMGIKKAVIPLTWSNI